MLCDVCSERYGKKMFDKIYRCPACRRKAEASEGWEDYVKEAKGNHYRRAYQKVDYNKIKGRKI